MYGGTPTFWKRELWDSCFQNPSESSVDNLVIIQGIRISIARKPYSFVIFWGGADPLSPSGSALAHMHSHVRAFTACLLKVLDIQVRKLSTPSPKDVDISLRTSNKAQFCSMVIHVHHKSVHSEDSDEFTHLARIQKVLPEGVRL